MLNHDKVNVPKNLTLAFGSCVPKTFFESGLVVLPRSLGIECKFSSMHVATLS